jgi:hypothetical protein
MPAREIKALVDAKVWADYYKICFERHPCERVISLYFWRRRREPGLALSEFIASHRVLWLRQTGFDAYTIDGEVAVDKVGLYENLPSDLEDFRVRVGLPRPLVLPRAKAGIRTDRRDFRSVLTADQRAQVARLFSTESALFGYEC